MLPEKPAQHATGDIPSQTSRRESRARNTGRLAEPVAPGKGQGVGDGKNHCDSCFIATFVSTTRLVRPDGHSVPAPETMSLTHKRQPNEHEPHQRQHRERDPQQRLDVVGQPEEAAVRGVDGLGAGLAALKHPLGVAAGRIDLVPPAQAHEAAARDVLEVVKVGGKEEDRDDEDEDAGAGSFVSRGVLPGIFARGAWDRAEGTYRFWVKSRPKR